MDAALPTVIVLAVALVPILILWAAAPVPIPIVPSASIVKLPPVPSPSSVVIAVAPAAATEILKKSVVPPSSYILNSSPILNASYEFISILAVVVASSVRHSIIAKVSADSSHIKPLFNVSLVLEKTNPKSLRAPSFPSPNFIKASPITVVVVCTVLPKSISPLTIRVPSTSIL